VQIIECGKECVDTVRNIFMNYMGWYHSYFASTCVEIGLCRALVALNNNTEIGAIVFYEASTYPIKLAAMYYIAVVEEYRGMGVGKALVSSAEYLLENRLYIATTQRSNLSSRKMFRDLGYIEIPFEHLSEDVAEFVEKITCSYEDDIVLYKGAINLEYIASQNINKVVADYIWRELCYKPWKMLRKIH